MKCLTTILLLCNGLISYSQTNEFSFQSGYATPDADIRLERGSRKVVSQKVAPTIGLGVTYKHVRENQLYYFGSIAYSNFSFEVKERFLIDSNPEFACEHKTMNLAIGGGVGKRFNIGDNSLYVEGGPMYVQRNARWHNVPSERELPSDLNSVNITIIEYDLFNELGFNIELGYTVNITDRWSTSVFADALFTKIRGDIIDARDPDSDPNMDRPMKVYFMGISINRKI